MAFPTSPTNGQVSTVNGISYIYASATGSWTRTSSGINPLLIGSNSTVIIGNTLSLNSANISTSTTTGALVVGGGAGIAGDVTVGGNVTYGSNSILNGSRTVTGVLAAPNAIDWFGSSAYRSGKYVISVTDVTNSQYQTSEIVLVQDGTTATISSYGVVLSGSTARMTFTANIMAGNVIIWGTGVSANNTVKLQKTLIPV
jgi:hypothetical protein